MEKLKILVVEDNDQIREIMTSQLDCLNLGSGLTTCNHWEKAVEMIEMAGKANQPFDLVITDLDCPDEFGGASVSHAAQRWSDHAHVIVVTGSMVDPDQIRRRCHAHEYLHKPYTFEELCVAITNCLGQI